MPWHDVIQLGKVLAEDLKSASGLIGSLTTFLLVAKSTIRMFGREKILAF
jgi:hypothetical protein